MRRGEASARLLPLAGEWNASREPRRRRMLNRVSCARQPRKIRLLRVGLPSMKWDASRWSSEMAQKDASTCCDGGQTSAAAYLLGRGGGRGGLQRGSAHRGARRTWRCPGGPRRPVGRAGVKGGRRAYSKVKDTALSSARHSMLGTAARHARSTST